jgi:dihydroorotate dehydrogenase
MVCKDEMSPCLMGENRRLTGIIAMSLFPYSLVRPVLFSLEPETAHELTFRTLHGLQSNPLTGALFPQRVEDPYVLAGLTFANRVGLAAGLDKNAEHIDVLSRLGFGFVEVGTVTPLAQAGNPKPRIFRLVPAQALINRLGFNNHGLEAFVSNVQKARFRQSGPKPSMLLGLNIGKNGATPNEHALQDYLLCLDAVYPYADYVTVNISSPNTKNLRALQSDAALDALLSALSERRLALAKQHQKNLPIFVKIAPDLDTEQIALLAATLKRYGTDADGKVNNAWGVLATNTTLSREAVAGLAHAQEAGGLSGAPVRDQSNKVIRQLRQALGADFPIIGVGGILNAADAVEKIQAGANVVQIYTGLIYQGPGLIAESAQAIKKAVKTIASK